jgi:hypothetical protein
LKAKKFGNPILIGYCDKWEGKENPTLKNSIIRLRERKPFTLMEVEVLHL